MKKLLRVVQPEFDESCMGLALRLAACNHLTSPWHLFRVAGMSQTNMSVLHFNSDKLHQLTGLPIETLREIACSESDFKSAMVMFRGHSISRKFVRNQTPRVCPCCLSERPLALAVWDLQAVIACPRHRVMLLDRCQGCDRRLSWMRPSVTTCRCGADIRTAPPAPAPDGLVFTSAALEVSLFKDVKAWRAEEHLPGDLLEDFARTPLQEMVGALSQIARLLMVAPRDFPYCESANVYTAVGDVLLDWPGALHTAFQEFASERLPFARFYPRHQGDLDVADVMVTELEKYKHWSVKASDTVRNFLSEEMWRCIGTVAPYLAAADKNIRRMSATPPSAQEWIPLGVAAKRLNMQCQTFNDLLASGAVEFKTETRGKLTRKLVKAASLTPDLRRDRMIGVRELNRITGLPVSTLEYLKASGDLPKNYKGPGSGFMAIQDLKTFEDRWSKIAVSKCPKGVETTDLHSAFRWTQGYGNDIAWKAEVVRRLLKGELKAFKVITKPTLNATLETAAVHAVRSEFVSHRMSFGDASDFLALERIGVMQLAVAGKLTPIFEGSTVLFSISELEEFKEAYVSLSRLSHSIEKGAVLATICRDNGIETLSVLGRRGPVVYVPKEAAKSIHAPRRARVAEC